MFSIDTNFTRDSKNLIRFDYENTLLSCNEITCALLAIYSIKQNRASFCVLETANTCLHFSTIFVNFRVLRCSLRWKGGSHGVRDVCICIWLQITYFAANFADLLTANLKFRILEKSKGHFFNHNLKRFC